MTIESSKDPRINYNKIEREKLLTKFYIQGFKNQKMDDTTDNECVESYNLGKEDKEFYKTIK